MNIQGLIADYLFNPSNKEQLLKALNENIDIPIIGEKTEAKILEAIWNTMEEVFKKVLLK
jgi:hypothetical protein|tara:strand:- start:91 stop:270 length:180 start_codon:yes stop_codon:yes gene_type:complete